ncbi:hypothetical protein IAI10_13360 [Clostridium sp. 19966]|uniref:hypothetical protein n=1 Tax=Clostridium sp. 19966 TaxID=2768166 RepID=UPI0028DD7B02|nr:hypothetical protein [Clostridium sp. 19966]MDT8717654.1 hypothetical protein [Clostridium sp. 19966]
MKRNSSLTYGFLIFLAAIPMILYLWYMFYNSADAKKAIRADWTNEYLNSIETDFSYLKNTDIYYKQGTIHFDFKIDSNTSLEDCKKM